MNNSIKHIVEKLFDNIYNDELSLTNQAENISYYSCSPKNIYELRKIIEERLEKNKNAALNDIDVSNITTFYFDEYYVEDINMTKDEYNYYVGKGLFEDLDPHNIKLNDWDVSNVELMCGCFSNCKNLQCDISKWNTKNVINMNEMFFNCQKFDSNLSNWNISNVEQLQLTFCNCFSLDTKNLNNWKLKENCDMFFAFDGLNEYPEWW